MCLRLTEKKPLHIMAAYLGLVVDERKPLHMVATHLVLKIDREKAIAHGGH